MEEKIRQMLYDNVDNPWEFVVKAAGRYKKEFQKTSKIGRAPSVEAVMGDYIKELTEGAAAGEGGASPEAETLKKETEISVSDA